MVFCGKCGENNPEESSFCWKCGSKLTTHQTHSYDEQSPDNNPDKMEEQHAQQTTSSNHPPQPETEHVETYNGVEMKLSGDTVTLTEKISKEECDRYRVPTILFGIISGIFLIIATCQLKYTYNVYIHGTNVPLGTESYTMLEMVSNGWSSMITVFFILIILFAVGSFYYYGLGAVSLFLGFISIISTCDVADVKSGLLSYDYTMYITSATDIIGLPPIIIGIVELVLLGITEFCFLRFCRQFSLKVPLTRALKELWKFS